MKEAKERNPRRRVPRVLVVWLALFALIVVVMTVVGLVTNAPERPPFWLMVLLFGAGGATLLVGLGCLLLGVLRLVRSLFCWRNLRRGLLGLAILATLIAIFYAEENWRGRLAWEECKREMGARGIVVDWDAYRPPAVPDDQNIFKAPKMQEWFVGRGENELSGRLGIGMPPRSGEGRTLLVEVTVVTAGADVDRSTADAVLDLADPSAREQAQKVVEAVLGPSAKGCRGAQTFVTRPLDEIKPARVVVRADTMPTAKEITDLFCGATGVDGFNTRRFQVEPDGTNAFQVVVSQTPFAAAEYVALTDPLEAEFDVIREALKRPYARMEGDYDMPLLQPIPNFVGQRVLAQTLAQRVQCHLLVGQPDKALRDLTLIHDACRLLEGHPRGRPTTLVAAMIHVAIAGLYTETVADGLRLGAWREPELAAIQEQLKDTHLLASVKASLDCEPAGVCRTLETISADKMAEIWMSSRSPGKPTLREKLDNPFYMLLAVAPRGWVYQNLAAYATGYHDSIRGFDVTNNLVQPDAVMRGTAELEKHMGEGWWSPFRIVSRVVIPNFSKARKTAARNQTLANEAFIACALERHRLAHGQYPESLAALVPQFVAKVPHDLIGGQPLKYRRNGGGFVLYSVGWNERDDGGTPGQDGYDTEADWVWQSGGN